MIILLAKTINTLNEKSIKYKVEQEGGELSMAFGLMASGAKTKVVLIPNETDIQIKVIGTEKTVDETALGEFLDTVIELKAIQEQEAKLIETLKA
jgi:tRNA A37 threonylcarbamoyltransferase TsaD